MSDIKVFQHNTFGLVRMIERDGNPWFLAADICQALGLGNTTEALRNLDPDERASEKLMAGTRMQDFNVVSESGMYMLIMRSNKPEAKSFRKWVTNVVLPSIRKTGSYTSEDLMAKTIADPEWAIKMLTALKEEKEKRIEAEEQRDEAIKKKRYITEKREATLFSKLGSAQMKIKALKGVIKKLHERLGDSDYESYDEYDGDDFVEFKRIGWIKELFRLERGEARAVSYKLSCLVRSMGLKEKKVKNDGEASVILYPVEAVGRFRELIDSGNYPTLNKYLKNARA